MQRGGAVVSNIDIRFPLEPRLQKVIHLRRSQQSFSLGASAKRKLLYEPLTRGKRPLKRPPSTFPQQKMPSMMVPLSQMRVLDGCMFLRMTLCMLKQIHCERLLKLTIGFRRYPKCPCSGTPTVHCSFHLSGVAPNGIQPANWRASFVQARSPRYRCRK